MLIFQVYLQGCKNSNKCWGCGATLLNNQYALTAAHCVDDAAKGMLRVAVGEHDLQADVETKKAQAIKVSAIVHPQWSRQR